MKKTILLLSAMVAMTACSNDETLEVTTPQAITFSNAFVDNSTRAALDGSYTKELIQSFQVYGTITNASQATANIFKGTTVSKSGTDWTYSPAQYWIPGNTYNFTAIVDGNVENVTEVNTDNDDGMPVSINLNDASQQKDILYAKADAISDVTTCYNTPVEFTFSHLLAKAKFTVKNSIPSTTTGYTYKVSDVKIINAAKSGVYTIGTGWSVTTLSETYNLEFGNIVETASDGGAEATAIANTNTSGLESNWERLMIPVTNTAITVSFKSELYINGVLVQTKENETVQATNVTLDAGHAYNFVISLGAPGNPITFTVHALTDWETDHNDDNTDNDETPLNE